MLPLCTGNGDSGQGTGANQDLDYYNIRCIQELKNIDHEIFNILEVKQEFS